MATFIRRFHLFKLLDNGTIDIFIGDKYGALYQHKSTGLKKRIRRLYPDVQSTPAFMAFSKKRNLIQIRNRFDSALREIKANGVYNSIIEKWEDKFR